MFGEREIPKYLRTILYIGAGVVDISEVITTVFGIGVALSPFISLAWDGIVAIVFLVYGVSFTKGKTFPFMIADWLVGFIPVLDAIMPDATLQVWWILRQNKKTFEAKRAAERAEQEEMNAQMQFEAQMEAQEMAALTMENREMSEYGGEEEYAEEDRSKSKTTPNRRQEDYAPGTEDFEDPATAAKKPYIVSRKSDRDPNTLDLRRKEVEKDKLKKAA